MESRHSEGADNFSAADYRVRLFLSVDLSGSTAFKNSDAGQKIFDQASPRWVTVFQQFYSDFPSLYTNYFASSRKPDMGADSCPMVWKAIGDELIFCGRMRSKASVSAALSSFIKALLEYRKHLITEKLDLNLKGSGWLAAFPEPNRAVEVRPYAAISGLNSASEALEDAADKNPFSFDFLGKSIDTGFRVAKGAQPERFTICAQLAWLLSETPRDIGFAYDIHADKPIELKGVGRGIPYPNLFIETLDHLPLARIRESERRVLRGLTAPRRDDMQSYLQAYCEAAGTDRIKLSDRATDAAAEVPESYKRLKALINEHLLPERGRGAEAAEAQAGSVEAADFDNNVEFRDSMTPLNGGDETESA